MIGVGKQRQFAETKKRPRASRDPGDFDIGPLERCWITAREMWSAWRRQNLENVGFFVFNETRADTPILGRA